MSRRTPLGKKDSCCCLLLLFIYEGPRNEKTETRSRCQGRNGGNLAFLGASNERLRQRDVCVFTICRTVCAHLLKLCEALGRRGSMW